jgi:probable rRNA maturation factor
VQYGVPRRGVPSAVSLARWSRAAAASSAHVTLRIVGGAESRRLNRAYRGKDHPTNVLTFRYDERPLRGDIALCRPVIEREAREQRKALGAHYAHLVIHGMLHLRGYDHRRKSDARRMERAEVRLLARLGFPDPYTVELNERHERARSPQPT